MKLNINEISSFLKQHITHYEEKNEVVTIATNALGGARATDTKLPAGKVLKANELLSGIITKVQAAASGGVNTFIESLNLEERISILRLPGIAPSFVSAILDSATQGELRPMLEVLISRPDLLTEALNMSAPMLLEQLSDDEVRTLISDDLDIRLLQFLTLDRAALLDGSTILKLVAAGDPYPSQLQAVNAMLSAASPTNGSHLTIVANTINYFRPEHGDILNIPQPLLEAVIQWIRPSAIDLMSLNNIQHILGLNILSSDQVLDLISRMDLEELGQLNINPEQLSHIALDVSVERLSFFNSDILERAADLRTSATNHLLNALGQRFRRERHIAAQAVNNRPSQSMLPTGLRFNPITTHYCSQKG